MANSGDKVTKTESKSSTANRQTLPRTCKLYGFRNKYELKVFVFEGDSKGPVDITDQFTIYSVNDKLKGKTSNK